MTLLERILWLERQIRGLRGSVTTIVSGGSGGGSSLDITTLDGYPNGSPPREFLREDATFAVPDDVDDLTVNGFLTVTGQLWIPLVDDGNSGTSKTLDWDAGNEHLLTLTGNVTLTLSNPKDGGRYVLVLATGSGGFTVTWPAAVLWPGGSAPTLTAAASKYDLITLIYLSGAAKYLASINKNY